MYRDIDQRALTASLRRLQTRTEDHDGRVLERSLQQVVDLCLELFGVAGCGIMLLFEDADLRCLVASGAGSHVLEQVQAATGTGPCVEAVMTDTLVASPSVDADARWPGLRVSADHGYLNAVLAIPLRLAGAAVGSLNVACAEEHHWTADQREALSRYAELTESMLATAINADQASELVDQLTFAVEYRGSIERGVGYLMARDGIDRTAAFHRLRLSTRRSRRKINEVAEGLLRTGRLPGERR